MVYVAERASVNQRLQWGAESTSALGTSVAANKLLECFDLVMGIDADVNFYRPTGRKYPSTQEENMEWMSATLGGNLDYNGIIYPLSGVMGAVAPVNHGASSTAKDWIFSPPVAGTTVPQTYTIEQGDATTRSHKMIYGLFTDFGYKGTRKDFTVSGKMLGQPITDGITMTASPTAVALAPVVAKQVNVYLDTTSGALGTTILTRVLSVDFSMASVYSPLWVLNRATTGFTNHVDMAPPCILKLKVEADANGMALLGYLQTGTTYFIRVNCIGNTIDAPNSVTNTFNHDMAVKFGKPTPFADDQGIFAIEWDATVVEDSGWGKSQLATVTNLITAL